MKRDTFAFILACFFLTIHSATSQQPSEGDIRLVDGYTSQNGRVEIYHNYQWGTVCDDDWDLDDADVVCRQLGYGSALLAFVKYGQADPNSPIWLDNVDCEGYEYRLEYCDNDGWGIHNCNHQEDAGVECKGPTGVTESGMAGWLIAIIVISSISVFAFIVSVIVAIAVISKKQTPSRQPVGYSVSGGVTSPSTTTEMTPYPTQNTPFPTSQMQPFHTQNTAVTEPQNFTQNVPSAPPPSYMNLYGQQPVNAGTVPNVPHGGYPTNGCTGFPSAVQSSATVNASPAILNDGKQTIGLS